MMSAFHFAEYDREFELGFAHGQKAYWDYESPELMDAGYHQAYYTGYESGWWNEDAINKEEEIAGIESEALGD